LENNRYKTIHYIRGFAALSVLLHHSTGRVCTQNCQSMAWGTIGVDIFFVISGFVMWMSTFGRSLTPSEFITKRFFRVAPLYYIMTLAIVAVAFVSPTLLRSTSIELWHVVNSFLFYPSAHPVLHVAFPVLIPGWTLNYEMFFYTIFACCLMLPVNSRFLGLFISLAGLVAVGQFFGRDNLVVAFYTSPIILEFWFGICIAATLIHFKRYSVRLLVLASIINVFLIGMRMFVTNFTFGSQMTFGVIAALIVWTACEIDTRKLMPEIRPLTWLGNASYSIYLWQMITVAASFKLWQMANLGSAQWKEVPFYILVAAVTLIVSHFSYKYIEVPFQKMGSRAAVSVRKMELGEQELASER
jgi:exopolysaccharide production protein ExoZ